MSIVNLTKMLASNERLRMCARPALGFRAADQVEAYGAQDDGTWGMAS